MLDVIQLWFSILGKAVNEVSQIASIWSHNQQIEKVYTEFEDAIKSHAKKMQDAHEQKP